MKNLLTLFVLFISIFSIQGQSWSLTGNSISTGNFIGTTNNQDIIFKRNNYFSGIIGSNNNSYGINTFANLTTGNINNAFGSKALFSLTTGNSNAVFGSNSYQGLTTGSYNTAVGNSISEGLNGNNNTLIGYFTGQGITTGSNNTIIGANVTHLDNALSNNIILSDGQGTIRIRVFSDGKVLMGDVSTPGNYKLYVEDGILTEKVKVALSTTADWADYVFEKDYKLMPLKEVESFIKENGHLPGISSAEDLLKEGIDLGQMQAKLLEKIEELTLYAIEKEKKIQNLEKDLELLKEQMKLIIEKQ